jgi:uncharacterized protein (TIGR00106 family)
MSVLLELTMFPMDKGESVSTYVAKIIAMIDGSGIDYQLTPMGTIIETDDLAAALRVVSDAYREIEADSTRVYAAIKLDIRKGRDGRLRQKVESIEQKMGKKVNITPTA